MMRLPVVCSQFMAEDVASARQFATLEWHDDGRYQTICPNGHASITILQEQRFELLFDIGAYALVDGYYREAVSSFASSLERFYEFFIKAVLLEKGMDEASLNDNWKHVAIQSERQFGAFLFVHLSELLKSPPLLSRKSIEFRNAVVHKDKIPSRTEALEYGQEILGVIRPSLREAKERYSNGVQAMIHQRIKQCFRTSGERASTMTIPTIISLSRGDKSYNERTLKDAIKELTRWT